MPKPEPLAVGQPCWLLLGTCLHEVIISEVKSYYEGAPEEFQLYGVRSESDFDWYYQRQPQHRSDLFPRPEGRAELEARIRSDINALRYILRQELPGEVEA